MSAFSEAAVVLRDRRESRRFPIALKLRYTVKPGTGGEGEVCDISSGGLLFRCDARFPIGKRIQISLAWPFLLNNACPLQLCISGRVLRSSELGTALQIQSYEFRTLGNNAPALLDYGRGSGGLG